MGRFSPEQRAELLSHYAAWPGTRQAFCAQHQIGLSTLSKWLRNHHPLAPQGFVEVRRRSQASMHDGVGLHLRIGRAELKFDSIPSSAWFADVVGRLA